MRILTTVTVSGALLVCVGCGGATKTLPGPTTSTNGNATATVENRTPVNRQEIVKATRCLTQERVRPARHTPNRQEVPRGANEMTRNGLPMTPQEYEATVRRCLTSTKPASASTHRK
jgi:hypothetical protein